jgi:hypothetical protein
VVLRHSNCGAIDATVPTLDQAAAAANETKASNLFDPAITENARCAVAR